MSLSPTMDGMGLSHIAEGYNGLPDKFRVLALSDIDPKRLHTVSEQFSIPRATVSFELLPMPDPDIIDICNTLGPLDRTASRSTRMSTPGPRSLQRRHAIEPRLCRL
jgi:hypothetical protein